ncbi:hypothetical protein DPMN_076143 [Dreissena polymorpha]|uniref:Uncharacterized protein n=1 Tax=Dreissena polymorpha TaxID=45954 RepID=A0A9D4BFI6_DREPO|nr:hypothetical protein DPMN_076143 [Dreissena polymorpha]
MISTIHKDISESVTVYVTLECTGRADEGTRRVKPTSSLEDDEDDCCSPDVDSSRCPSDPFQYKVASIATNTSQRFDWNPHRCMWGGGKLQRARHGLGLGFGLVLGPKPNPNPNPNPTPNPNPYPNLFLGLSPLTMPRPNDNSEWRLESLF